MRQQNGDIALRNSAEQVSRYIVKVDQGGHRMVPKTGSLRVGRTDTGYLVFVQGRGTMCVSRSLHDFALRCADSSECTFAIDLSECEYLDSTFLGCLVDLYKRFGRRETERYQIIADEHRSKYLLATSHLHTILPIANSPPKLIAECLVIRSAAMERSDMGHHIMECHRLLAELDGPNQAVFRRIADQLASELKGGKKSHECPET